MNAETFQTYKHSGKFGVHGPVLAILAAAVLGFPLGIAYAYLIRWIPFIYINFFATLGYGVAFGLVTAALLKMAKVRNNPVAFLTGLLVGLIALYFAWSGYMRANFEGAPYFSWPNEIIENSKASYQQGTWTLRGGETVSGPMLALVWLIEAAMIVGMAIVTGIGIVSKTPYCEDNQCWLDQTKHIDTLGPFIDPNHRAAFQAGDLSPLTAARPKIPGTEAFTRLTLKYSPKCDIFYTVCIQDANITLDKNGNPKTNLKSITKDLVLPHSMFDLIAKFENFKSPVAGVAPQVAPPPPGPAAT